MPEQSHVLQVTSHPTILGDRWRWDCSCGRGAYGYTSEEAAAEFAADHPESARRYEAMWAAAESRRSG